MKEKENSAFRLYRLVGKMVSQPSSLSTAQVLLNAVGSGDVKGREQSIVLSHTIELVFAELNSLIAESTRRGFSDESRQTIVSAIDRLSVLTVGQGWQNHAPAFQASRDSLRIFGEGLFDEGPPISKDELTNLQQSVLSLREEVKGSALPTAVKDFVYQQLSTIEQAIKDYPIAGLNAFRTAAKETLFQELEHPQEAQAFQQTESASKFNAIVGKVREFAKFVLDFGRLLKASNSAIENAETLANKATELAHHVESVVHHLK